MEEAPIFDNHKTTGVKENETAADKSNDAVRIEEDNLDNHDISVPIELFTPESSVFETNANRFRRKALNNLWYNTYENRPFSGLEYAFLNRLSLLRNLGVAKRRVRLVFKKRLRLE